jgi:predicted dinucleotide-binding enzyme
MKIAVLGTGMVGDAIGSKLVELGHEVMMGSRTTDNEKALGFAAKFPGKAGAATFADAIAFGELVFNCIKGENSVDALRAGVNALDGKIVVDISNPLDFSKGMPPSLIPELSNTHSLGEELQKTFPQARIVKTLNTMWCGIMVNPNMIGGGNHVNFICGDDSAAKEAVRQLLGTFGWKQENILDLGGISAARGTEGVLPVWLRIWGATQNGAFNFQIVS